MIMSKSKSMQQQTRPPVAGPGRQQHHLVVDVPFVRQQHHMLVVVVVFVRLLHHMVVVFVRPVLHHIVVDFGGGGGIGVGGSGGTSGRSNKKMSCLIFGSFT